MTAPQEPAKIPEWVPLLVAWYHSRRREMPWREQSTPYRVWISEIMLQQTQVNTVVPYFERFLAAFPNVTALAAADLGQVLKAWEGLGYYSRARNLHAAARLIAERGTFPDTYDELLALPGVGGYTAAAIASIAYGLSYAVVDGNVLRVFARFRGIKDDISLQSTRRVIQDHLQQVIEIHSDPSAFNQAMMELGALVCRPRQPDCGDCPLSLSCAALASGMVNELPVKRKPPPRPHYRVAVGLIRSERGILIARRPEKGMLGGLWEFPGGKVEEGETLPEAVVREVREETDLKVCVGDAICTVDHTYTHFSITLTAYWCDLVGSPADLRTSHPVRWVQPDELRQYPFPKANHRIFTVLGL